MSRKSTSCLELDSFKLRSILLAVSWYSVRGEGERFLPDFMYGGGENLPLLKFLPDDRSPKRASLSFFILGDGVLPLRRD